MAVRSSASATDMDSTCRLMTTNTALNSHSGKIHLATGKNTEGNIALRSGDGVFGANAGDALALAGTSAIDDGTTVGIASGAGRATGGDISVIGGAGCSSDAASGGDGGSIKVLGGSAFGEALVIAEAPFAFPVEVQLKAAAAQLESTLERPITAAAQAIPLLPRTLQSQQAADSC